MMLTEAVVQRIYPDTQRQENHKIFKKGIMDYVDAKYRKAGKQ